MATLNLDSAEFANIAMIWFLDQVTNPEQVTNPDFVKFLEENKNKLKSPLLKYYFSTDSNDRLRYRRISGAFDGSDKSVQQIRITYGKESEKNDKKKESKLKKMAKAVINKVMAKEELDLEEQEYLKEILCFVEGESL